MARGTFNHLSDPAKNQGDYARLARFLNGTAVGVVLGGGGARGFAHLGVLRALERPGIEVDLVGGNCMGALIGAQFACDIALDEICERTMRFALGEAAPRSLAQADGGDNALE